MANRKQLDLLNRSVTDWNMWRQENENADINLKAARLSGTTLSGANLRDVNLSGADLFWSALTGADLSKADLYWSDLTRADLSDANLRNADLSGADLSGANLKNADLSEADLSEANLSLANLSGAHLPKADLTRAYLWQANLSSTDLVRANLYQVNLLDANFSGANLSEANLSESQLVGTNLQRANLSNCRIFGISAWNLKLDSAEQSNLIITDIGEPQITVDNLEIAQFIYLLLHNEKLRDVIDTVGNKAVLILGRFTDERKAVLEAIREELRKRDYIPILFDFEQPPNRNLTETVKTLAHLSKFIVADLTDPRSIPYELGRVVPDLYTVAVQPIIMKGESPFGMFGDLFEHRCVLPIHEYESQEQLIAQLPEKVIQPAEAKVLELRPK